MRSAIYQRCRDSSIHSIMRIRYFPKVLIEAIRKDVVDDIYLIIPKLQLLRRFGKG